MSVAPIAIAGMGCICAAGGNLPDSMKALLRGERRAAPPVRFASNHPVRYPVFEAVDFEEPPELLRTSAFALHAAREAVADAGLDRKTLSTLRVGVCVGTTVGTVMSEETFCRGYLAGDEPDMAPFRRILHSNPADVIAREFDLSGPRQTVVTACS